MTNNINYLLPNAIQHIGYTYIHTVYKYIIEYTRRRRVQS